MSEAALPASQMRGIPPAAAAPSSPAETVQAKGKQTQFRLIAACSLGNALEMYDFTVYSFFALLIGKLFFPSDSPYGSLLLAVATFGIGFVMRPLGGVIIGSYADRKGRKSAALVVLPMAPRASFCRGFRLVIGMKICDSSLLCFA